VRRTLYYIVAAGLVLFGWHKYQARMATLAEDTSDGDAATLPVERAEPAASRFRCDGRVYCSQMTSCEEATWFLQHCPGVKMDGEGDGVPCERQWCGHH
jgi:Excalibur calcium-binding domain